jgi:hypothetical protein
MTSIKPQLTFRVGFVGHRPDRLTGADMGLLAKTIRRVLLKTKEEVSRIREADSKWYSGNYPLFQAISPLAEGSDRLFSEVAMDLGFGLSCPMPFPREEYEKDFLPGNALEPDSLKRFHELLARASKLPGFSRFELTGDRNQSAQAYGVCGQIVLNQSDFLMVVWDGVRLNKTGGTEDLMKEALHQHVPVIWIDAVAPHAWQLVDESHPLPEVDGGGRCVPSIKEDLSGLAEVAGKILALPGQKGRLADFYREKMRRYNPAFLWQFFRNLIGKRKLHFWTIRKKFPDVSGLKAPIQGYETTESAGNILIPEAFMRCDRLSGYYGDHYRSGYFLTYLLAGLAVGLALFPLAAGWLGEEGHPGESLFILAELLSLLAILFLVFRSQSGRWHTRWLDYRLVAEWIRQLKQLAPLGIGKTSHETRGHHKSYEHSSATWMAWYVRSLERNLGLPDTRIDRAYLKKYLADLHELLSDQQGYHSANTLVNHRIEKFLHRSGIVLISITIASCLIHLVPVVIPDLEWPAGLSHLLTFLCGFLPALGAAMAGINNQGEFKRLTKTSESMQRSYLELSEELAGIEERLNRSSGNEVIPLFPVVRELAHRVSHLMLEELNDWRITYHNKPQTLPA